MQTLTPDTRVLIVGLGLIGGSYAKALTAKGYRVDAVTLEETDLTAAREAGVIVRGATHPDPALLGEADLVIMALYPAATVEWLRENQRFLRAGTLITDTAGVKTPLIREISLFLRPDLEFIGAHPMAGREVSGYANSDPAIFRGANYIVVPTPENTPEAVEICRRLGEELGFSRVSTLTPEEHDRTVGFVSQLTHCIAIALMTCNTDDRLEDYTGDSFRDLTRIARINDAMWSELFLANREALTEQFDAFIGEMQALRDKIAPERVEELREQMRYATHRRALFDKK